MPGDKIRVRRSFTGCITCRARKVRCDERPTTCLNCDRIGVVCGGYSLAPLSGSLRAQLLAGNDASNTTNEAGIRRRSLYGSCEACGLAKVKCSRETPSCARCQNRGDECRYMSTPRRYRKQATASATASPTASVRRDQSEVETTLQISGESGADDTTASSLTTVAHPRRSKGPGHRPTATFSRNHESRDRIDDVNHIHSANWLTGPKLPDKERIGQLVEAYFANVHPLRCYSFIHKPSFMESLDSRRGSDHVDSPLLYIVCALGAKFCMLDDLKGATVNNVLAGGNAWAEEAQRLLFRELGQVSIENLMVAVLLCDHHLRIGNYAGAFMLSGIASRMAQALQINLEYSTDVLCSEATGLVNVTGKESRRRLMWSCYIMDSWVGSGVDQLTLLHEHDIKIQLPCIERNFLQKIPCITETITKGQVLKILPEGLNTTHAAGNMGLVAHFIRLIEIRKKVLSYIKGVDFKQTLQLPEAEFTRLEIEFKDWHDALPSTLQFTIANLYIRKESHQLGALLLLHCVYHTSICDLHRIGNPYLLPSLLRQRLNNNSPLEYHRWFLLRCQKTCYSHAKVVANIFGEAAQYGGKVLADTWLCTAAFESTRIILYHLTQGIKQYEQVDKQLVAEAVPLFKMNMKALRLMIPLIATAEDCYKAAYNLLKKAGFELQLVDESISPDDETGTSHLERLSSPGGTMQATPESVLLPLSIFRMARQNINEKHTPEQISDITTADHSAASLEVDPDSMPEMAEPNYRDPGTRAVTSESLSPEYARFKPSEMMEQFPIDQSYPWQYNVSQTNIDALQLDAVTNFNGPWLLYDTVQETIAHEQSFPWLNDGWEENSMPYFSIPQ